MYWCCTNYLSSTCTRVGGAVALQLVCDSVFSFGWGFCVVFSDETKGNLFHS